MTTLSYGQLQAQAIRLGEVRNLLNNAIRAFPEDDANHARLYHARTLVQNSLQSIRDDMAAIE